MRPERAKGGPEGPPFLQLMPARLADTARLLAPGPVDAGPTVRGAGASLRTIRGPGEREVTPTTSGGMNGQRITRTATGHGDSQIAGEIVDSGLDPDQGGVGHTAVIVVRALDRIRLGGC